MLLNGNWNCAAALEFGRVVRVPGTEEKRRKGNASPLASCNLGARPTTPPAGRSADQCRLPVDRKPEVDMLCAVQAAAGRAEARHAGFPTRSPSWIVLRLEGNPCMRCRRFERSAHDARRPASAERAWRLEEVVGLLERERRAIPSCLVWASAHPRTTGRGSCEPVPRPSSSVGRSPEASLRVARWHRVLPASRIFRIASTLDQRQRCGFWKVKNGTRAWTLWEGRSPAEGRRTYAAVEDDPDWIQDPRAILSRPLTCAPVAYGQVFRHGARSLARCTYVYGSPSMTSAELPALLTLTGRD
ncbi:hypothetical protein C8Q76DRAFT_5036 [Earliella scabrosa]|nr:hypothetical protein C8Q76DRAFT_5036 [Earliella scabrosa]